MRRLFRPAPPGPPAGIIGLLTGSEDGADILGLLDVVEHDAGMVKSARRSFGTASDNT
jgi:hypothetical protein